jgi:hypothetical protein
MSNNATSAENQQERFLIHSELTPDYVLGLVDGEGYFSVTARIEDRKTYKSHNVSLVFGIKLSTKDGEILKSVKEYFGCGNRYYREDLREKFCDCLEYQVRSHRDMMGKIIPFFRKHHLRFSSKKKAFSYLCEIADMIVKREHLSEEGIKKAQRLAKLMH